MMQESISCALLVKRLHGGEQNDLPDGVAVGKQHDAAVDADAQAARGRHTVLQGGEEVLVHHAGLVIALGPQLHLLLEAAPAGRWGR